MSRIYLSGVIVREGNAAHGRGMYRCTVKTARVVVSYYDHEPTGAMVRTLRAIGLPEQSETPRLERAARAISQRLAEQKEADEREGITSTPERLMLYALEEVEANEGIEVRA